MTSNQTQQQIVMITDFLISKLKKADACYSAVYFQNKAYISFFDNDFYMISYCEPSLDYYPEDHKMEKTSLENAINIFCDLLVRKKALPYSDLDLEKDFLFEKQIDPEDQVSTLHPEFEGMDLGQLTGSPENRHMPYKLPEEIFSNPDQSDFFKKYYAGYYMIIDNDIRVYDHVDEEIQSDLREYARRFTDGERIIDWSSAGRFDRSRLAEGIKTILDFNNIEY